MKKNRSSGLMFSDYALSPDLDPDEIYTIELLIEKVRDEFDPDSEDNWSERDDAREAPDYEPSFSREHVRPAEKELGDLTWLSLQRLGDAERPIRDLSALRYLHRLTGLVLKDNEVTDISALASCVELKQLHLSGNPIRDISALAKCVNIEELHLGGAPIEDLSPLQNLPKLRELSISVDQIPAFRRLKNLPTIQKLSLDLEIFDSFEGFPKMLDLRHIEAANVRNLKGLEKFSALENLEKLIGPFDSLTPVRELTGLTHLEIFQSRVSSLEPLAGLPVLRVLWLVTDARSLDLTPLESLPALREITVDCDGEELASVARLRQSLGSWDIDFRSADPRHTPSLELEVVDQKTFDVYDTERLFNLADTNMNEGLLGNERDWLDTQIRKNFSPEFKEDEDYVIPDQWSGARSRTVVLLGDRAVKAFPRLVSGIQKCLSYSKNDWIIYFQSDDTEKEFIVWLYPSKIMVTQQYAKTVWNLIQSN